MQEPLYINDTPGPTLEQAIALSSHLTPKDVEDLLAYARKRRLEIERSVSRAAKKTKPVRRPLRQA